MVNDGLRIAARPREFVGVRGPDAPTYLEAMLSNAVEGLEPGASCDALLLTPKARVIAPLTVLRRSAEDYLLLTEPGLAERVRHTLLRSRFAAKVDVELEEHTSAVVLGGTVGLPTRDYGVDAVEMLDAELEPTIEEEELERLRIRARTPRPGRELDDRVLPAEAGLDARAIDFQKGCYPGQEPVARLHYRGHANRELRVLEIDGQELPDYDAELARDGKVVGRVTSAVANGETVLALGYVRREVPADAVLELDDRFARQV